MIESTDKELIVAFGTIFGAAATIALTIIAYVQLKKFQHQIATERKRELRRMTIAACTCYVTDPVLKGAMRTIWYASAQGCDYRLLTRDHHFDVLTILNYLQGIAVGLDRGIYDDREVRALLEPIVRKSVLGLLKGVSADNWHGKSVFPENHFPELVKLYAHWCDTPAPAEGSNKKIKPMKIFTGARVDSTVDVT